MLRHLVVLRLVVGAEALPQLRRDSRMWQLALRLMLILGWLPVVLSPLLLSGMRAMRLSMGLRWDPNPQLPLRTLPRLARIPQRLRRTLPRSATDLVPGTATLLLSDRDR